MSAHGHVTSLSDPGPFAAPRLRKVSIALVAIGILGLPVAYVMPNGGLERIFACLLQGMLIPTFLSLAALFYLSVHVIGGAKWVTPVRRIMESLTSGLWLTLAAFLVIALAGGKYLYEWIYTSGDEHHHLFHIGGSKAAYMTFPRFLVMNLVIIAVWLAFRYRIIRISTSQDELGGALRPRLMPWSVAFVMVFAVTLTSFVWDLLLSLQVNWFSTMWGVYCFASAVQTFLCVTILLLLWLRKSHLRDHLPKHVMHDLGTWMVAWSCFCAYIGFSQFMLIYYANMDEETYWYLLRTQNGHGVQYWIEAIIRWPLPFLGLMSQKVRTNPKFLCVIAIAVLAGNWMDWSWIIQPVFTPDSYQFPFMPDLVMIGAGFAGGYLLLVQHFWQRHGIVAKKDPDLLPVVNAEHLH